VEEIKQLLDQYPFITYLVYGGNDYIGIIQNADEQITTIYDFGSLRTPDQKLKFLELGEQWWWESNRLIPINVFLKADWAEFKFCVKTMNSKDVEIKVGPQTSLREMANKRSKRRSITLVRRLG
jgi:LPS sulfotransferase NodH